MADESNARSDDAVAVSQREGSGRTPNVFVTDASSESDRISETLRLAGYSVTDVPLTLLVTRANGQRPHIVIVDVDADGALDATARLRRSPGGGAIDFLFVGTGDGPVKNADDALASDGSAFFARPVDLRAVVRRVESLTGGPSPRPEGRLSTPPPSLAGRRLGSTPPSERPSLPAPGLRSAGPPLPMSGPSLAELADPPRSFSSFGGISNELQQLLAEAELRADVQMPEAPVPSPEEEIESVLPADVLASLDEPIEGDEDQENDVRSFAEGTGAHAKGTTAGGSKITASGRLERRFKSDFPRDPITTRRASELPLAPPPSFESNERPITENKKAVPPKPPTQPDVKRSSATFPREDPLREEPIPITDAPGSRATSRPEPVRMVPVDLVIPRENAVLLERELVAPREREVLPPSSARGASGVRKLAPAEPFGATVIQRPVDARRFFAQAITRRLSGALCFEHAGIVRRLVIRDGDLVTAASGAERESLVCFLGARGELPRDEVDRLDGKIPPYGRHAGAALVGHGWLGQDQLWTVLRAHAEWIASAILRLAGGTAQLEIEPPGRLRSEPSVFAASTGPEVFVELVRRAVSPEEAVEALGGDASRIGEGSTPNLLSECSLSPPEVELVTRARGGSVGDLISRSGDVEVAALVHALALLAVLDVVPAAERSRPLPSSADLEAAALDDEAVRARVRAKLELVEEGDYFSVLGVSRYATSYDVRRAFIELRRSFEPTRILSPRLADLSNDVRKIVLVLEEAYEILRDIGRRERYRRAIDASP